MKRKNINFFAIFGIAVAMATVAFTAPTVNPDDGLLWFLRQSNGTYSKTPTATPVDCPPDGNEICALGFEEMPTEDITDTTPTIHVRYIEE